MGYAVDNSKIKAHHEALPDTNGSLDIDLEDSFLDSLLSFEGWVEDHPNPSMTEVMNSEKKPDSENVNFMNSEKKPDSENVNFMNSEKKPDSENVNLLEIKNEKTEEVCVSEKLGELGCFIEEGIGKVCLSSGDGNDIGKEINNMEVGTDGVNENESVEEDESSSSSSSSSGSSDEDESDEGGLQKVKVEIEEGEIMDEVPVWSDDDDDDDDTVKGPIRSMNEVQDLPLVPPVNVTIQPHHQTLPVGVVLSIMGSQVIVEGTNDHNPLNEGSILWVTENRTPLGVVDEIFGPVKNPYYIVRYNSETEIPTGIQQGSLISFVPEFADHVLNNNNNLYKKGYDASGENDEECSEELEFSDDEKEAEYKRTLKTSKRGSSGGKNTRVKKGKKPRNRGGNLKNDHHHPSASSQVDVSSNGPNSGPQGSPSVQPQNTGPTGGPHGFPSIQSQNMGLTGGPHGFPSVQPQNIWPTGGPHGFPSVQQQNMGFPANGFPSNLPPFMQQNFIQQPFQNFGVPNLAQFGQQNFVPNNTNFVQGGYGPFGSWSSGMVQNNFNPLQVGSPMMFHGLPSGVAMPNGLQMENSNGAVRPFVANETSQNHNQGDGFSNRGGRKPLQRGRGGFRGKPRFG